MAAARPVFDPDEAVTTTDVGTARGDDAASASISRRSG